MTHYASKASSRTGNSDEEIKTASRVLWKHVDRVLINAHPIYKVLDELKEHLEHFQEQVLLEDLLISFAKTNVLAKLWTVVGGNKRELEDFNRQLALLKGLRIHGRRVLAPVTAIRTSILAVVNRLEEMRKHLLVVSGSKK